MNIECIRQKMRSDRLRWLGHVERKGEEDWVSKVRKVEMGPNVVGRKKWEDVLKADKKERGIPEKGEAYQKLVQSRDGWREACNRGDRVGEGEVQESVRVEDVGACGTAARADDPGPTRRLTRSSSVLV